MLRYPITSLREFLTLTALNDRNDDGTVSRTLRITCSRVTFFLKSTSRRLTRTSEFSCCCACVALLVISSISTFALSSSCSPLVIASTIVSVLLDTNTLSSCW
eukprot:c9868_g2_i5.p1 GENE.c9868_g2_i5~~c9868_g2_i5.p1  ORF type:complete len:103 (+),score=17.59 c9868_g2_i5:96-404(+)